MPYVLRNEVGDVVSVAARAQPGWSRFEHLDQKDPEILMFLRPPPSYKDNRAAAYPSLHAQLDMQYWDQVNNTTIWRDTLTAIKKRFPKEH